MTCVIGGTGPAGTRVTVFPCLSGILPTSSGQRLRVTLHIGFPDMMTARPVLNLKKRCA